jgi:hypothetical protein
MATDLELIIKAKDQASRVIQGVGKEVDDLGDKTEKTKGKTEGLWKSFAVGQIAANLVQDAIRKVTSVVGDSIKMAIDAEEAHSKFGTVFASVADKANESAKDLATNWGLSKYAAETMLSATGDLLTGLGLNADASLDLSTKTQKLAIDLASFTNFSGGAKGASEALTKAMLGERESIKSLGIVITEEMVKEELLRQGKDKLTGMALYQARAEATLAIAMQQSKNAMGDYARTQDSTANVIKRMQATFDDLKIAIGTAIVKEIAPALKSMKEWFDRNKEAIATWAGNAIKFVKDVVSAFISIIKVVWDFKETFIALAVVWAAFWAAQKVNMIITSINSIATGFFTMAKGAVATTLSLAPVAAGLMAIAAGYWAIHDARKTAEGIANQNKRWLEDTKQQWEVAAKAAGVYKQQIGELNKRLEGLNDEEALRVYTEFLDEIIATSPKGARAFNEFINKQKESNVISEKAKKANEDLIKTLDNLGGGVPKVTSKVETLTEKLARLFKETEAKIKQDKEWADLLNGKFGTAIESHSDAWVGNIDITKMAQEQMDALQPVLQKQADTVVKSGEQTKKWTLDWKDANEVMEFAKSVMGEVKNALSAMGVELGPVGESFLNAAEGAMTFVQGLIKGNPLAMIAGGLKVITSLIKAFSGDGVGEAIERENKWMNLTKEQIKQLKELEKQYGSTHAATSVMLDEIINTAEVTNKNFDMWTDRVRGILSDLDQGKLSIQQTQKEIGDAFTSLLGKAKELGTEGSASLMNFFDDLASRGLKVGEVQDYINEQLEKGLEGYKAMKAAMGENADAMEAFGNINIEVYEEMIRYQNLVEKNKGLVNGIKGAEQALISLSNTQRLTEEQFDSFSTSAKTSFDKLIEGGMNSSQALQTLAPYLQRLQFLHEEYGYTIDENTQKILDQAKQEGKVIENKKTETQTIIDLLGSIAEALGAKIPEALSKTAKAGTEAFKEMTDGARQYGKALDKATEERIAYITTKYKGGGEDIGAAKGFEGWISKPTRFLVGEAGPEYVSVKPKNKIGSTGTGTKGGNVQVEQNIYINGVNLNKDEIINAIKTAIPNNEQGLKTIVQQAMAEAY